MFVDMLGKTRIKLGLHTHTTDSDGRRSPEEAARMYAEAGYDAIAITDHWKYGEERELSGLKILSGCEYDFGGATSDSGVYHIVAIGTTSDPCVPSDWRNMVKTSAQKAAKAVEMIKLHNGLAVLAHPAWSLNTVEQIKSLGKIDAIEIYNSVSDFGMSDRGDSSLIIDMLGAGGNIYPLIAADDTHHYTGDEFRGAIMVEATDIDSDAIVRAVRAGRFYATQGPEVHAELVGADKIKVYCSPVEKVVFNTNVVWVSGRIVRGENIIEAEYVCHPQDRFVRVEVTDAEGKRAWSNPIVINR